MAARVFSQQLDRTKPLWELWLVEGLRKQRFALISKTHHALVDGVAGVDIATVLFDVKPVPEPAEAERRLDPEPGAVRRRARRPRGSERLAKTPVGAVRARRRGAELPEGRRSASVQDAAEGARRGRLGVRQPGPRGAAERADRPAPALRLGPRRPGRVQARSSPSSAGPSTTSSSRAVAGALRRWLRARGVRTEGLELRALVPVSIRADRPARRARQPDRGGARTAARLRRGPGRRGCGPSARRWTASSPRRRRSAPR